MTDKILSPLCTNIVAIALAELNRERNAYKVIVEYDGAIEMSFTFQNVETGVSSRWTTVINPFGASHKRASAEEIAMSLVKKVLSGIGDSNSEQFHG